MDNARLALLEFQQKRNLGSVKETGDAAPQRLDKLEAEYQEIKTLRQRLESRTPEEIASGVQVDSLRNTPEKSPGANNQKAASETSDPLARFDGGSKYSDLKLQIKARQAEWDRQRITLKLKHPFMVRLANDIQQLNQELQHQLDLIEEKRRARIKSLKADEESYRPLIEDLRQQVLASRNVQYQYERLKEEESNIKSVLDNLRKAEESLNSTTRDEGLFNIIEEGGGSSVPIRPNRRQIVLAGLVIGLGLGLGLIYLLGRLDDRMELAEDIEAELDEPVLGQLPLMDLEKNKETGPLVTNMDEHRMFYESMRGVRSAIIFGSQGPKKQVLLMTSAAPGDGKTTFSVNFALTLGVAGHRVLLVDADMRRGDTHGYFKHDREPGLAEVLQGQLHWSDVMKQGPVNTVKVIHTGKLPSNPGELLISPITREFIDEVRKSFDYVLFDCPPLTAIDDTFALVGSADGILFIVRSGQTSMRFAKTAIAALRQHSAPLLGFVLNGIKPDNPYYYYKNYYHDYYAAKTPQADDLNAVPAPAIQMAAPKQRPLVSAETQETLSTDEVERSISIARSHPRPTNDGGPAEKGPLAA